MCSACDKHKKRESGLMLGYIEIKCCIAVSHLHPSWSLGMVKPCVCSAYARYMSLSTYHMSFVAPKQCQCRYIPLLYLEPHIELELVDNQY